MKTKFLVISLSFLLAMASAGNAELIGKNLDYDLFGHLSNEGPLCAPTSTVNSFLYLMNQYPTIYGGTQLLTDYNGNSTIDLSDLDKDRDLLAVGWTAPGGESRTGTGLTGASYQSWWEAKVHWVEDWAPETTIFNGMVDLDTSTWYGGSYLTKAVPTWEFLWQEISDGEDIEITISGMHALTLTSLKFEDMEDEGLYDNGIWDPGFEDAWIDYLDPNNPSQLFERELFLVGGQLKFSWFNDGANPAQDVFITAAYSESPVPEPATILLLCSGIIGLAGFRKKVKKT